ncbi:glycosyltransferase [Roseicitreum antarcticum]|uniref:Glycosyltransferase, GT2 family n=1 Tax=Roseicitreum antarcticum TaxID=564137 RepID=A0A1H2SHZ0_9RHOB|nr:glycosyltransferase family 2 protein [Roseicitreum antarcticum]SDW30794.1 Glycosyltransferase, GT2 family [Roseicitreum antarcticum]
MTQLPPPRPQEVAAVVIGRNEAARLRITLPALCAQVARGVYVDSGSRDDSVAVARAHGLEVVELDTSAPFSAARGRNAGVAALRAGGLPEFVQLLDGDCEVQPGWVAAGLNHLRSNADCGIVAGQIEEIAPGASIYNALCDVEWRKPAGEIASCTGTMLLRGAGFAAVGGFNPSIIAAEDDDFCLRMRAHGLRTWMLARPMARHDADLHRFAPWWRRMVRAGYGFAQVGDLHPGHFTASRRRVLLYGLALPVLALAGLFLGFWLTLAALALYALSWGKTARGLMRGGQPPGRAAKLAGLLVLTKPANLIGLATYYLRRARRQENQIIEYK